MKRSAHAGEHEAGSAPPAGPPLAPASRAMPPTDVVTVRADGSMTEALDEGQEEDGGKEEEEREELGDIAVEEEQEEEVEREEYLEAESEESGEPPSEDLASMPPGRWRSEAQFAGAVGWCSALGDADAATAASSPAFAPPAAPSLTFLPVPCPASLRHGSGGQGARAMLMCAGDMAKKPLSVTADVCSPRAMRSATGTRGARRER